MTNRKRKWLIGTGLLVLFGIIASFVMASSVVVWSEGYIREQTIQYLRERFDSDIEVGSLRVRVTNASPLSLVMTRGRGVLAQVEGEDIALRHRGRRDLPPMFVMKKLGFKIDLATLLRRPRTVPVVTLDGLDINIPPTGQQPESESDNAPRTGVFFKQVVVNDLRLTILPQETEKVAVQFNIPRVRLESVGKDLTLKYDAELTFAGLSNPVLIAGNVGPWIGREPGKTPVNGRYALEKAALGVISGVGGDLHSAGELEGSLALINVRGQADVPNFRLKASGNHVPLTARFEALIDGKTGITTVKPADGRLGATDFTTGAATMNPNGDQGRMLNLDVFMPQGTLPDLLRLAAKGSPFLEGQVSLRARVDIPALSSKGSEKLRVSGQFDSANAKFLRTDVQDQVDSLSRRGQGEPKNESIAEVVSAIKGVFDLAGNVIRFRSLSFDVPGAEANLAGDYAMDGPLDFHGTLKLDARASQTMTGWKKWLLKPVDALFSKNGAGTVLKIKVEGTADAPRFGLDPLGKSDKDDRASRD